MTYNVALNSDISCQGISFWLMNTMAIRNNGSSSRTLRDLQGVRLATASQVDSLSDEELVIANDCGDLVPNSRTVGSFGSQLFLGKQELPFWKAAWDSRPNCLKTLDCDINGDRSVLETIVNVATSLPFIAIGLRTPRKKPSTRWYADSLVGVGAASCLYHVSRGEARKVFRLADYAMIAMASLCLNAAVKDDNPRALMVASALFIPVQPMLVTVLHTGIMEATFARRVRNEPKLKRAHNLHKLSSVIGGVLFAVDDIMPNTPYIHAAWHLAAALGVGTCSQLLD